MSKVLNMKDYKKPKKKNTIPFEILIHRSVIVPRKSQVKVLTMKKKV